MESGGIYLQVNCESSEEHNPGMLQSAPFLHYVKNRERHAWKRSFFCFNVVVIQKILFRPIRIMSEW
ncbi:hypothetical protein B2D07_05110 [Desulfococcus multivorans]|nr:uncharacterized protein Dmul_10520 [Desulfococcus multivorans]AQV00211.1 hypothetical protein B2D07_05110 [Desulfococcus multivorans]